MDNTMRELFKLRFNATSNLITMSDYCLHYVPLKVYIIHMTLSRIQGAAIVKSDSTICNKLWGSTEPSGVDTEEIFDEIKKGKLSLQLTTKRWGLKILA